MLSEGINAETGCHRQDREDQQYWDLNFVGFALYLEFVVNTEQHQSYLLRGLFHTSQQYVINNGV